MNETSISSILDEFEKLQNSFLSIHVSVPEYNFYVYMENRNSMYIVIDLEIQFYYQKQSLEVQNSQENTSSRVFFLIKLFISFQLY